MWLCLFKCNSELYKPQKVNASFMDQFTGTYESQRGT